jgi:nucleotide-binding universal stress UspA family protein
MFGRIVVPLDGSPFAETALDPARTLAHRFGSKVLVVWAEPSTGLPLVAPSSGIQSEWARLDRADAYLHDVVSQLRAAGYDADFELFVSEAGSGIARAAELSHADVIVMAAHVRWALPAHAPASTTLSVLAHSKVPIFVFRAETSTGSEMGAASTTNAYTEFVATDVPIIVPLDGSRLAEAALSYATALARAFGSYLVLTRIIAASADEGSVEERQAADYLQAVREEIAQSGGHAVTAVQRGTPLTGIETVWRQRNGGLIVMASHGLSGRTHTLLGSVAARMIEEIEASILVIRPQGMLASDEKARRGDL